MTLSKTVVATCLAMLLPVESALAEFAPSQAEIAALPAFCAAKLGEGTNPEPAKVWRASMGSDFTHMHHYCFGLNFMNRARRTNGSPGAAVGQFDYVLKNTSPGFYMRPEILMNRGIALSMMKRNGEAVADLLKSIELDPKQPRAYMALSDLYEKQKNRSKALDIVTGGLRHNPGTKSLQRRYTALGGKLPYPAPDQAAAAEASAAQITATPTSAAANSANPAASAPTPASPAVESAAESAAIPKIGSPKNPYCRFCPD